MNQGHVEFALECHPDWIRTAPEGWWKEKQGVTNYSQRSVTRKVTHEFMGDLPYLDGGIKYYKALFKIICGFDLKMDGDHITKTQLEWVLKVSNAKLEQKLEAYAQAYKAKS